VSGEVVGAFCCGAGAFASAEGTDVCGADESGTAEVTGALCDAAGASTDAGGVDGAVSCGAAVSGEVVGALCCVAGAFASAEGVVVCDVDESVTGALCDCAGVSADAGGVDGAACCGAAVSGEVAGALCCLMGGVWFLQGVNVLPGSFMTGQTQWAVYGGIAFAVGFFVLYRSWRKRPPSHPS